MTPVNKQKAPRRQAVKAKPRRREVRTRDDVKRILEGAFRKDFPHDTVDVSDGYKENIHVVIVSRKFDEMTEREREEMMWAIVDGTKLHSREKNLISLLLPLSPKEIK